MGYKTVSYEKRIKENIKNYDLSNLYDMELIKRYLENIAEILEIHILLTNRHGEKEIVIGDSFLGFHPDVEKEPGRKLRIQNRTVGHLYAQALSAELDERLMKEMLDSTVELLMKLGEEVYLHREGTIYQEELEKQLADKRYNSNQQEKEDILTGVFNKNYFETRMNIIDRSEVVPVAVIHMNINDWKFVNDNFGSEESDRLICIAAEVLRAEAKPEFVIGRIDGDVFGILIPMAEEGEAEDYAARVQEHLYTYDDPILAPSIAAGIVYKTNIEKTLEEALGDAEYEMFNNKFEIKNSPGYRERLEKAI